MAKILYITTNLFGTGGVSRVLSVRLDYLIERYHYKIHIITTNNLSEQPFYKFNKDIIFHDIDMSKLKLKNFGDYKNQLKKIIDEVEPNIIANCDNGLKGAMLPYLININTPLIYERHGSKDIKGKTLFDDLKNKLANFILNRSIKKYKAFVVLNEYDKQDWSVENICVIPNPNSFKKPKKASDLVNKIAIAVGRHSPEKQFDKLLSIWKKVVKNHPDWVLKIYGQKDSSDRLQKLVSSLEMESNVVLLNPVENMGQTYSEASMLLHTSTSEAFGLVIVEAMSFGLPVIAFDRAHGPKSLIEENSNGYLVRHNAINAYVEKINLLISDHKLRKALGTNGRITAQNYNIRSIAKKWDELYKQLI